MFKVRVGLLIFTALFLSGCLSLGGVKHPVSKEGKGLVKSGLPLYSGPKAKVAIADFEVKAAKASIEIGAGFRQMLVKALTDSQRFLVVEREPNAATQEAADLIITGEVNEFEPESSGGKSGVGGGGGVASGVLGSLLGVSANKARMALDIRIVDASSSEVIATNRIQGQASDVSGLSSEGLFSSLALGEGLAAYSNTPMEKAIRVCVMEAARYVLQKVSPTYYKY